MTMAYLLSEVDGGGRNLAARVWPNAGMSNLNQSREHRKREGMHTLSRVTASGSPNVGQCR